MQHQTNKNRVRLQVDSANLTETETEITAQYEYRTTQANINAANHMISLQPVTKKVTFRTQKRLPRLGVMLVGWGGNNGSTVTAGILANRHKLHWQSRSGTQYANYFGSIVNASTLRVGYSQDGEEVYVPLHDVLPIVEPNELVVSGWDINNADLATAMDRAQVLEPDLKRQLAPLMKKMHPLPSVYSPDFIASNQSERANNLIPGTKSEQLTVLRANIRDFRSQHQLNKVIVVWTANTERFANILKGVNDTADNLLRAVEADHNEISPSSLFAVASILEDTPFINGSPQNTFLPGVIEVFFYF